MQLPEVEAAFVVARPAGRRDPRAGRRLRLQPQQVQPRHAGVAPAGLVVQAVHLLGGAREGLHRRRPSSTTRRWWSTPRQTGGQALGAEELRRQVRRPDAHAHGARQVEEHGVDPHAAGDRPAVRAGLRHALRLRRREAPALPHHGARRRLGDAVADGARLLACSPTAASASSRTSSTRIVDDRGNLLAQAQPQARRRRGAARDRRAQRLHDGQHDARRGALRHRRARHAPQARRTSPARPAPPTTTSTPGSPATSRRWSAIAWIGFDQPKKLGNNETGGAAALPIWIGYMEQGAEGRARELAHAHARRRRGGAASIRRPACAATTAGCTEFFFAENVAAGRLRRRRRRGRRHAHRGRGPVPAVLGRCQRASRPRAPVRP